MIWPVRGCLLPLGRFTAYATLYRYPGESGDVTDEPTAEEVSGWLDEIEAVRDSIGSFISAVNGPHP